MSLSASRRNDAGVLHNHMVSRDGMFHSAACWEPPGSERCGNACARREQPHDANCVKFVFCFIHHARVPCTLTVHRDALTLPARYRGGQSASAAERFKATLSSKTMVHCLSLKELSTFIAGTTPIRTGITVS